MNVEKEASDNADIINHNEKKLMSPRSRGRLPSRSSSVRIVWPWSVISWRICLCSGLSCLTKNSPCRSSIFLRGFASGNTSLSCCGCVSSLSWEHTPSSSLSWEPDAFSSSFLTKTCSLGKNSKSSSASSSSWPSMSTFCCSDPGMWAILSFPATQM